MIDEAHFPKLKYTETGTEPMPEYKMNLCLKWKEWKSKFYLDQIQTIKFIFLGWIINVFITFLAVNIRLLLLFYCIFEVYFLLKSSQIIFKLTIWFR